MTILNKIIDLPTDLNVSLFSEWTDPFGLARLDSAMCNKQFRNTFLLKLFVDQSFIIEGFDHGSPLKKLSCFNRWMYLRSLKFRKIFLIGRDEIVRCNVMAHDSSKINSLEVMVLICNRPDDILDPCVVLINSCRHLNKLLLFCVGKNTSIFASISNNTLKELKELNVWDEKRHPISVQVASRIASLCSVLIYLNLGDSSDGMTERGVVEQYELILKNNPLLLYIRLVNGLIADSTLLAIQTHCRHVKQVSVEGGNNITISAIMNLQSVRANTLVDLLVSIVFVRSFHPLVCHKIGTLRFSLLRNDQRVVRITDLLPDLSSTLIMRGVFQQRHPITKLVLNSIPLTSDMLLMMANSSPKLRLLAIDSCGVLFSKDAVKRLLNACCESLTHLHLGDCHHFTPDDLIGLVAVAGKRLRVMSIVRHPDITPVDVSKIIIVCPVLNHLYLHQCSKMYGWHTYKRFCCLIGCDNGHKEVCVCTAVLPIIHDKFDSIMFDDITKNEFVVQLV
jgi:hypothetical protein